jgi:hypothetical protein
MTLFGFDSFQIAGLIGVAFYLGSYAALQIGFLKGGGYLYTLVNGLAASFVLISLFRDFNLSSAIIQIAWIVLSIIGLSRLYIVRNALRFSEEERFLIDQKLPGVDNDIAKRFLKAGEWIDVPEGAQVIAQDEPVSHLYFVRAGSAQIICNGVNVAERNEGAFLGEITCFTGSPATGTVKMSQPTQCFRIAVEALRDIAPNQSTLRNRLEETIACDLRAKLSDLSQRFSASTPGLVS